MSSLNLTEAWKGIMPPSPSDTVEKTAAAPATPTITRRSPSPEAVPPSLPDSSLPPSRPSFLLSPESSGLLEPGNIDLARRPVVREADGRVNAVRSISIGQDGREYLIPTVSDDGSLLSDQDAINLFKQTGRHLGAFKTMQDANEYADKLHRWQETMYASNPQDFQGAEVRKDSPLVSAFPGQAATPLSPPRSRSLFDRPLASPLISSSSPSAPAYKPDPKRIEELHALILHRKKDPELDALLERNPSFRAQAALEDGSMPSRAALGEQIIRELLGEKRAGEPGFYFLATGEKLPETATRQEAYAAVYDHYAQAAEKQYEENKARRAAYQKNRAEVEQAVSHVVGGVWSPADLNGKLTPEQLSVYRQEFDTNAIEKAHAAFSFLKQAFSDTPEASLRNMVSERTAMKITSALSDDDGTGKLTINETAFGLFEGSLRTLMSSVKEQSGDEWKFMHNLRVALFNPATKRDATLGTGLQLSGQQQLLVPFAKDHNAQVFGLMEQTVRDYETYVKNDHENARVLGLLSTGQDMGNQSNDQASFAAKTVNCLGSVCGQTASFFLPYAGWGIALAAAYDDKRNRAYYEGLEPGTAEWSAFVDAAASVAVEKISYGGLGRLSGAGWVMGKLPFMAKTRAALTDSLWKKILFESGAGVVEETLVEPTAEAIIQWAVRSNIAPLAAVDVGGNYDWNNYWNELKGMLEPDQLLATALFVGGLAGGTTGVQSVIAQRSLITHSRSPEMLRMQGIPEDEATRISRIEDNKERIAAVREAVNKLKTLPPEEVFQNAKEGVKAFRSLAEVRATVESEAYKFFQQEMRLPLVEERADKPGTYQVTVFDSYSGQKKFSQEMTEGQLISLFGDYFSEKQRKDIAKAQSDFAANAFLRSAEEKKAVQAQNMLRWGMETEEKTGDDKSAGKVGDVRKEAGEGTEERKSESRETSGPGRNESTGETEDGKKTDLSPSSENADSIDSSASGAEDVSVLGRFIRSVGSMSQQGFSYLARSALNEWNRRLASGISQAEAGALPFPALSPFAPLRSLLHLDKEFAKRMEIASRTSGEEDANQTLLFQMRTAPGTTPADYLFLVSRGLVGSREMLEDLFEVGIKHFLKGNSARLQALGELLRETQAGLNKLGFRGEFISPAGPLDEMKVVEAMSKLALSDMLVNADSLPLPEWQKDLLQYHVNFLQDAAYLLNLGRAYNMGREKGTITQDLADTLRNLGEQVYTIFDQARIEQQDIQAVMEARAIVDSRKTPGVSSGAPTASQIREKQKRDSEEEKRHVSTADRSKERTIPKEALQHPESVSLPEAPESMQGVFVNGASYNPDAGTWIGMVPVEKLHLSPEVPQVKVNAGKKGVVNPLVGEYRADAPPVYVWKRKDGRLEVVSGRHRLDLAQRTGTKAIAAYVYEEDSSHDVSWARLLDYEQNMQDDQADELTAAIYVRETGLTDDELTRRGLTRSGTKSRRGLLIGREAREDLWTRFRSGAIKAQDAEAICLLTQHIQDKGRIDAMQMSAANDLSNGKSLEFVAAKIQLMAHAQADGGMVQGLISFGESFEADMENATEYVARCIVTINDHINAIKGVRSISRKGNVLTTEGITAGLSEDPAERLKELELLKAMYEKIGLYENLRIRALTWDGKTPADPIGDHRLDMQAERARAAEEAAAHEDEENRKAASELTDELSFSVSPFRTPFSYFPALWREVEKELNDKGNVSFSLNGSRVTIYTFPEREIRKSLEVGGMSGSANRIADIPSDSVSAGEIACILHPESLTPDARSTSNQEAAKSGKRLPLSAFSGFILPSSLEDSFYPALQEIGVPVRVYHVTEEEAAFFEDPRSMGKDEVEKDALRRKELRDRRNNVVRSFLEENDVSFSLSAEERRITATARREDTWMRAPDGTPTALTERQWLQVHSEAFKKWFGESKIVNEHGEPVVVYHGTARADRVGTVFRGDRATSGPMAFFTDDEKIASNYAKDKRDTSIGYEEEDYYDYHQQFRVTLPSGRDISLERYWHHLSLAEQRRITTLAGHIREDWDGDDSIMVDPSTNDANGGFPYHLQEARGNAFRALVYHWLESGTLFNEEHRFLEVLAKLNLPLAPRYRDPDHQEPKVYACFMHMENPFRTAHITKKTVASLKTASKKAEVARESWRTDLWDKNSVVPEDWIERLENDYENKTTHAWTAIPDWVTECLRKKGYDGIIDQGGKFHADDHTVCIPFDSIQIKSATDNRGTFDPGNPDITFSLSPEERLITEKAKEVGTWLRAPNGQPSRLTEKQWAQTRTKAFLDWYGDWLHGPASASQTLDENGEPLIMYHGGAFDIRQFPAAFEDSPGVDGIFFSDSPELAKSYKAGHGGYITTAWLNLKNPFLAQNEASSRLPWVDRYIDYWQKEEGWTDRYTGEAMDKEAARDMIREGFLYDYDMGRRWKDFLCWVRQHHDGYLGHDPTDMGALIAVAFRTEQVKSSLYNTGEFSSRQRDITFSLSNLAVLHSLNTEKFLAADKLGGLPLPSLAVTRLDKPYTFGGEDNIYLVGSPALADPARGVEIHDRDAWSGYFPQLRWNVREHGEREAFFQEAQKLARLYHGDTDVSALKFLKNALDGDHRGELENKLRHNEFSQAIFAKERGYAPRPKMTGIPARLSVSDPVFHKEVLKMLSHREDRFLHPDRQEAFCAAMERAIDRFRATSAELVSRRPRLRGLKEGELERMERVLHEARGDYFHDISYMAVLDARNAGKRIPDWNANYLRFQKYSATHRKAFEAWVADKMERWIHPMPRIKENSLPATLNNLTQYMLGSKQIASERGLVFSTGLLRAKQSRRFDFLNEIKEARDMLVTTEEHKASEEEGQNLIHEFQAALNRIVDHFSAYDNAVEALSCVRGKPTPQKVLSGLKRFYAGTPYLNRIANNSWLLELGVEALSALKTELRDYFEAVPQRAVLLKEFSLAVLPASMKRNKQVRDVLKRNGIRPRYHDGTLEGRIRVLSSLAGTAVSFSVSPGPSFLRVPGSSFMASLSEEERAISEKALASGSWLKVPNGQPSRLTPRQWVQVRTEAFKRWFGDWLDDPGHASRVVDENGEPRVVYHGTPVPYDSRYGWLDAATFLHRPAPFSVFGEGSWYGAKFFFDDYERAQSFASYKAFNMGISEEAYTFECFLNARKLFNVTDKEAVNQVIDSFPDSVPVVHPQLETVEEVSREAAEGLVNTSESWILTETKEFQRKLQELGYDGFVAADRGDYYTAVFKPGQIKSATENAGSFASDSPDITFSVIGPRAATWKQYEKKAFIGRDDKMPRAEIDASQAVLKDRGTPYREPMRRELAALRETLPAEIKKQIARYLTLHRQFYKNKRTLNPENNVSQWHEYLTLEQKKENWNKLLSNAILRTGLCRQRPLAASVLAGNMHTLELLLREDMEQISSLADLGIYSTRLTLEEWIHYPELFAAYPQLRNMPVITDYLPGLGGQYSPAEGTIYLNRNLESEQQVRSVLLHELQHAIQHIEGFAKGGNESSARRFYEERRKDARTAYRQSEEFMNWLNARDGMISTLQYMLSLARHPRRVLRTSFRYSYDGITLRLEGEERILDMARYTLKELSGQLERYYDASWNNNPAFDLPWPGNYALNTPSGIKECLKDAKATPSRRLAYRKTPKPNLRLLYQNMLRYERLSRLSSFELYLRMAGEIESRHVENRKDWPEERRAAEPFNDTLEFPGEGLISFSLSGTAFSEPATEKRSSEDFLSSLTEEERRIADMSWENGTWLLAPNGEPSRLTPRQWVQVRTDAFRHWFGEWEHDPLEASRVVDDNGEPLVVYHGGTRDITVFGQPTEDGLYFFTENASLAEAYRTYNQADYNQTHLYRTWLNIRNPLILKEDSPELTDTLSRLGLDTQSYQSFRANGLGRQWLRDMVLEKRTSMRDYALTQGYDGIFDYEPDMRGAGTYESYIVFHPGQIKSATRNRGTFDPRNPDISFSLAGSLAVQQSITSEDTSMRQVARTFRIVHEKFGGWKKGSVNIDIGGGKYDDFTQALDRKGVKNYVYDPFARHASHNGPVLEDLRKGVLKGDSVTCNNVLNVIPEQEARFNVIHQVAKSLTPEGTAWFCVYEGDGSGTGRITKTRAGLGACWQENRKTESYLNEIRPFFEEVEIRHGLIIARVPRRTESPAFWRVGKDTQEAVSFSVVGPSARTWEQYRDRAFVGRDDGKMRAEIDSSQAKLDEERLRERDFSELEDMTDLFTATSDIKPLIGTRAARFYVEARETSRAFRAGEIKAEELDDQYRRILRKWGLNREADLTDSDEFHDALKELTKPFVQAVRDLWNFFLNHPLTENSAFLMDGRREIRYAVQERLAAFLAFGNYRYIHLIFPRSGSYRTRMISEVLDYPELFAAYPILKGIKVDFRNDLTDGADGVFVSRENRITLSIDALEKKSPAKLRSFLLHELQHAVQEIESFALGGNFTSATDLFFEPVEKERSALRLYLLYLDAGLSEMKEAVSIARNPEKRAEDTYKYRMRAEAGIPMNTEEKHRLGVRLLEKSLSGVENGLSSYVPAGVPRNLYFPVELITIPSAGEAVRDGGESLQSTMMQVQELLAPLAFAEQEAEKRYQERMNRFRDIGGSFGAYQRLAGEIESRNVQHREDWPEERRAAEPFNDTLEFPGETLISFSLTPGDSPANIQNRTSSLVPRTFEDTTFSLSSLKKIVSSLAAPSMQATRAAELVEDFDKAAENWSRVMAGKEEKPSARVGAELFGTINSLISAARFVLPQGYRSHVNLQMQWASVYAAMAESGEIPPKGTLQSGDIFYQRFEESVVNDTMTASTPEEVRRVIAAIGNQRLDRVMSRILDRVRDRLVYFAKDELFEKTMRRMERAYPKKEPGQKSPRGRLEAQAYRNLAQYRFMLAADSKFKENTMTALETKYREEEDVEKQQEQEKELLAWKTFGDYKGMSFVQAQNAMEKLLEFVLSGRNAWDRKLDRERGRTKFIAREIQKNLPTVNSATSRAGAKIEHHSRLKKFLKSVPFGFMSYSHLMLALEPILGQRFTRARMQEIADANAALLNASNDRSAWLYDTICRIAGLKSESAAEQWLVKFNKPEKTKIPMNPVIKIKVSLPIDEAKEWFSLSKEERNARRAEIRENDRRMEIISENVPEEEDISLLREALEEYEKRSPEEQDRQEILKSVRDIPNPDGSGPLVCSRDCALYAILLHEQPDYADVYDEEGKLVRQGFLHREGLDDEGITALYEFVGTEGLEYGYALRKRLQETGLTLAQVYEERMGVPFTLKENYFRATFDHNSTREKDALTEPKTGSIGGGKYGLLIDRILHSENLDFSKAASLVFLAAAAEQDNYIYTSHITTAWRALLKNKILEQKLKQNLGEDMMGKLSSWMDLIDGASLENNRAFLNLSRMQGMLQRAFAISVLAGNGYVLLKQSTSILHGFFAGWVPSAVLERADGTREMVHRHISFSDFLFHLAGAKLGLGDISLKDLKETPWFKARMRDKGAMLAQIANLMPGQRYSPLEKLAENSMDIIEWVDVKANLHSMHALANAYYAKAKELNEMNEFPFTDAQLRQAALQQVGLSLELGAQPLTKTQRSMNQAAGGILSKLAFVMKSEQLNKLGMMAAEWQIGSARNRVCAVQSWLALGVTSSLLAWLIAWIKGMDDDDDEKKWKKYGTTALLGDLTTIPLAGEAVNYLASLFTGERVFADSYARTLVDVGGITRAAKKEYEHLSEEKEMDWDAHFNNITALIRAAGVGGAFSRSSSAVVSSYSALSLSAATGANISRTAKDLLTMIFREPEKGTEKQKKKSKTGLRNKKMESKNRKRNQ